MKPENPVHTANDPKTKGWGKPHSKAAVSQGEQSATADGSAQGKDLIIISRSLSAEDMQSGIPTYSVQSAYAAAVA